MLTKLSPVVVGYGVTFGLRYLPEPTNGPVGNCFGQALSTWYFNGLSFTTLAVSIREQSGTSGYAEYGVTLPVTNTGAVVGGLWSLVNPASTGGVSYLFPLLGAPVAPVGLLDAQVLL